jgi:hypothetical protein
MLDSYEEGGVYAVTRANEHGISTYIKEIRPERCVISEEAEAKPV